MRFCTDHWTKLKAAIDARGLTPLIATSGEQAAAQLHKALTDGPSKSTFDPLMAAHNLIFERTLRMFGLEIMNRNDDGSDRCPVCFAQKEHDEHCKETGCELYEVAWFRGVSDAMRIEAIRLELLASDATPKADSP